MKFKAWAIDTRSTEGHGFIGRYWTFGGVVAPIPEHLEGCKVALFTSRRLARIAAKEVRGDGSFHTFANARAIRVTVEVRGMEE